MEKKYIVVIVKPNGTFYLSLGGNHITESKYAKRFPNEMDALKEADWIAGRTNFGCFVTPVLN